MRIRTVSAGPVSKRDGLLHPDYWSLMTVTFNKRQKERARQERNADKQVKREERKRLKAERPDRAEGGVDPDIAHITPGPQPPLE